MFPIRRAVGFAPLLLVPLAVTSPSSAATPFNLIVVPDSQNYADFSDINTQYSVGQMRWIRDNMTNLNIKFVMQLGDLQNPGNPYRVQANNIYEPDLSCLIGDPADTTAKWNRADDAIQVLDNNHIPYSIVPGDHDYRYNFEDEPYLYLKMFGPTRYINNPKFDEKGNNTYGGASPATPTRAWAGVSSWHHFYAGGYTFLNIALQDDPDQNDLAWAQEIINENPNMPTILTTHEYVNTKGASGDYQHPAIFNQLVQNNPQIVMTFNGHLSGGNHVADTNIAGQNVEGMLMDYQSVQLDSILGGDYYRGAGTLRQVQFDLDNNKVNVKDYSAAANKFIPANTVAPDNDGTNHTYDASFSFNLNLKSRFGLPDGAGIKKQMTFQNNVNGYTGGRDTMLDQNDPDNATHGSDPTLWVDGDRNGGTSGTPDSQVLLRFDFILDPGNLPAGAHIDKAQLTLHTSNLADSDSPNTIALYRLLKPWTVSGTWNSQTNGISDDGSDAILAPNDTFVPSVQNGFITVDVTESLATWMAGAENYGWAFFPGGGNGWQFDSAENSNPAFRPQLVVDFTVAPEPTTFGLAALGVLIAAGRRSRRRV